MWLLWLKPYLSPYCIYGDDRASNTSRLREWSQEVRLEAICSEVFLILFLWFEVFFILFFLSSGIRFSSSYSCDLTHLPLNKMATISQTIFSDAFSWMKIFVFWLKFHWSLFLRVQLTIAQHGLDNGLAPNRRQAVIWNNADPIHWCIFVALGEDELRFSWFSSCDFRIFLF